MASILLELSAPDRRSGTSHLSSDAKHGKPYARLRTLVGKRKPRSFQVNSVWGSSNIFWESRKAEGNGAVGSGAAYDADGNDRGKEMLDPQEMLRSPAPATVATECAIGGDMPESEVYTKTAFPRIKRKPVPSLLPDDGEGTTNSGWNGGVAMAAEVCSARAHAANGSTVEHPGQQCNEKRRTTERFTILQASCEQHAKAEQHSINTPTVGGSNEQGTPQGKPRYVAYRPDGYGASIRPPTFQQPQRILRSLDLDGKGRDVTPHRSEQDPDFSIRGNRHLNKPLPPLPQAGASYQLTNSATMHVSISHLASESASLQGVTCAATTTANSRAKTEIASGEQREKHHGCALAKLEGRRDTGGLGEKLKRAGVFLKFAMLDLRE